MNRYQIYLDPKAVGVLDEVSEELGKTRSAIIRDVVARVAREYGKIFRATRQISLKRHPLMKMAGIGKSPTGDVASGVDEIYLRD